MSDSVSLIIGFILSCGYIMLSFIKLLDFPKKKRSVVFLIFILFVLLNCCNYFFIDKALSTFTMFMIVTMINYLLYHNSLLMTVISSFLLILVGFTSDAIFGLILLILSEFGLIQNDVLVYAGSILPNVIIPVISFIIVLCFPLKKIYEYFLKKFARITDAQILFFLGFLIASINLLTISIFREMNRISLFFFNSALMLFYAYVIYCALKNQNQIIIVKEENKELTHHLHEYENILIKQRRKNHENKTELVVVRDMLNSDFKKGMKCLDEIIGTKEELDETFYERCQQMPSGIQGVIYQRLLVADPEIKTYIEVSPKIPKEELEKQMTSNLFLDACKIIGVFIGNAVEEVDEIKDKDNKVISVQLYLEGNDTLVVQIGNTYRKGTDFNKLGEEGYTTKGEKHGQGLSLVKELEEKHENLDHETVVNGKLLFQKLNIRGLEL